MNIENIELLIDTIRNAGKNQKYRHVGFNMNYMTPVEVSGQEDYSGHDCGTAFCIMGWWRLAHTITDSGSLVAFQKWLGIDDYDQVHDLVYPDSECDAAWSATPEQAVKIIEHLRDTGKTDWSIL